MPTPSGSLVRIGALLGFIGVAAGTFGAHGLQGFTDDPQRIDWWRTGVLYHLVHALAVLAAGLVAAAPAGEGRAPRIAGWSFAFGTLIFSGTLYAMALGAPRWLGAITPLGGVGFLVGWAALARAR
ncbi:MAG: DUF423 domain-containing protein [Planctomycetota bacterium]